MKKQEITPEKRRNIWFFRIAVLIVSTVGCYYAALCIWTTNHTFTELWNNTLQVSDNEPIVAGLLFFLVFLFPLLIFAIVCAATDMSDDPTWDDIFEQYEKDYKGQQKVDIVLQKWLKDNYDIPSEVIRSSGGGTAGAMMMMTTSIR